MKHLKSLRWCRDGVVLEAIAPDEALVRAHAETLRDWYNAPANAEMMGSSSAMSAEDVRAFWRELAASGAHGFLVFAGGELAGDMDLRDVRDGSAELAVMVGASSRQGRGLGRAFCTMLLVHAFRDLGLERVYVQFEPENVRMRAVAEALGCEADDSPRARALADHPGCVTQSVDAAAFRARAGADFDDIATA